MVIKETKDRLEKTDIMLQRRDKTVTSEYLGEWIQSRVDIDESGHRKERSQMKGEFQEPRYGGDWRQKSRYR